MNRQAWLYGLALVGAFLVAGVLAAGALAARSGPALPMPRPVYAQTPLRLNLVPHGPEAPLGGEVGSSNAWLDISPVVISPTTGIAGVLSSGWQTGEMVAVTINGSPVGSFATDGFGF